MMTIRLFPSKAVAVVLIAGMCAGCATIIGKGSPETLNIRTTPDQAKVEITDEMGIKIYEGKTPTIAMLEKKKGYFSGKKYAVKISKDGYIEQTVTVDTQVNGWYLAGNLVFGGLIGWFIVDPATGAMWTFDTNEVATNLSEGAQAPAVPAVPATEQAPAQVPGATTSSSGQFGIALQ